MKRPSLTAVSIGIFMILWILLLPLRLNVPLASTLADDAGDYNTLAIHLVQDGMYSMDGVEPYFGREPGMSLWLAAIYSVFGIENRLAVFVLQGLLLLGAAFIFKREFEQHAGKRVAEISLFLFLLLAPIYHAVFSFYRESLALSVAMLFAATVLHLTRTSSLRSASIAGVLLGYLALTYIPFLLLPVLLIPLLLFINVRWQRVATFLLFFVLAVAPWGIRNTIHTGAPNLTSSRSAIQQYVRGVQTRDLRGLEPLKCLYSEYISRNWDGRSPSCSFNAVVHQRWPEGFQGTPEDIQAGVEGRQLILADLPNYAWLTVVEVLELHLPYVNGWGFLYNILAALGVVIVYVGIPWTVPLLLRRTPYVLILAVMALYHTAVFSLTDATPRYLLPALFCYTALSGIGYSRLLSRFSRWTA